MMNCRHCHTCRTKLQSVLDGEEWCPKCENYQRYRSHGWAHGENSACPDHSLTPRPAAQPKPTQRQLLTQGENHMNRDEIIDHTGAENWHVVKQAFDGLSQADVLAKLNAIFPTEDNDKLAAAIANELK